MMDNRKNVQPEPDEEFERVYKAHSTLILNIAYNYLKDIHLAQDVMQEVLLRYLVHRDSTDITFERKWLVRITINLCINIMKKRKKEISSDQIELVSDFNETLKTQLLDAEYQFMENERQKKISAIGEEIFQELSKGKKQWYQAMQEVYENEKPGKQVAREMGMTKGAFYTMLCRVRGDVRKKYRKRYKEVDDI